ncbi:MAG: hypothetical protein ACXAEN_18565 [Candidatus Thorarchaeota archaeon]|jgi:hypothetical protein
MTEIPVDIQYVEPREEGFRRSEKFEINDLQFKEITVEKNRIMATVKKWAKFELLISFIGAAWMEKWRRFGYKMLVVGIILTGLSFYASISLGSILAVIMSFNPTYMIYITLPFVVGIVLIIVWLVSKREALLLFTPGGMFKIEGSVGFVEDVWKEVVRHQRIRDV